MDADFFDAFRVGQPLAPAYTDSLGFVPGYLDRLGEVSFADHVHEEYVWSNGASLDFASAGSTIVFAGGDIANDATTTASISIGGSLTSYLDAVGDRDWIAIDLTVGDEVTFFAIRVRRIASLRYLYTNLR